MSVELRFYVLATWLALSVIYPLIQGHIIVKVIDLFLMFEWSPAFIAGMLMADIYKSKKSTLKMVPLSLSVLFSLHYIE